MINSSNTLTIFSYSNLYNQYGNSNYYYVAPGQGGWYRCQISQQFNHQVAYRCGTFGNSTCYNNYPYSGGATSGGYQVVSQNPYLYSGNIAGSTNINCIAQGAFVDVTYSADYNTSTSTGVNWSVPSWMSILQINTSGYTSYMTARVFQTDVGGGTNGIITATPVNNGCSGSSISLSVTATVQSPISPIVGSAAICKGLTSQLTDATAGGIYKIGWIK